MLQALGELRLADLVDIAIVASLIWLAIGWFRTSRARLALLGLSAVAGLYLVARGLELRLTTLLLQGFFAVVALMLVVVFQDDLRRLFEGIAVWGLRRGAPRPPPDVERQLVHLCFRLAQARTGALIVLPGREPLERHLDGGVHLDGRVSEPLLMSLFDPDTPGHDGAVVLRANKVIRFGVHLPLSTDFDGLQHAGTRHAAALGLAERSDALCLIVSEERGEVSVAVDGQLKAIAGPEQLSSQLQRFVQRRARDTSPKGFSELLSGAGARWREGVLAVGLATALWYLAIPGGTLETVERSAPIVVENLPEGYELIGVEPEEVVVTLEGRRRDIYMAGANGISVRLDALLVQLGRRTFELTVDQVKHPARLEVVAMEPVKVRLSVEKL